jgi:hypothetical protein
MQAVAMDRSTPVPRAELSRQAALVRQLLPLLCCLAIQGMWLVLIRGLEGVVTTESGAPLQARPSLNL